MANILSELQSALRRQEDDYEAALVRDLWNYAQGKMPEAHTQLEARIKKLPGMPIGRDTFLWMFGFTDVAPPGEPPFTVHAQNVVPEKSWRYAVEDKKKFG